MRMIHLKSPLLKLGIIGGLLLSLCACGPKGPTVGSNQSFAGTSACINNTFLQKYHCSVTEIQESATYGEPDAQYALGYLYFYGIGVTQDMRSAILWMKRSAAQEQPLAKQALLMINKDMLLRHSPGYHDPYPENETHIGDVGEAPAAQTSKSDKTAKNFGVTKAPQISSDNLANSRKNGPVDDSSSLTADDAASPAQNHSVAKSHLSEAALGDEPFPAADNKTTKSKVAANHFRATPFEKQLLNTNPHYYAIQLMGSYDLHAVQNFLKRNHMTGTANYYAASLRHHAWYMLVYGKYPSIAQAHLALQRLPAGVKEFKPWIKPYSAIQKEIKQGK